MRESTALASGRAASSLILLTIFTLLPLYVMVISSLKPLRDVQGAFTWWPLAPDHSSRSSTCGRRCRWRATS